MPERQPTFGDILAARRRLGTLACRTPLIEHPALNARVGARVRLKAENLQRVGAFKFRGAYNKVSQVDRATYPGGVVACSSGNHAQGVAAAATLMGFKSAIVMPADAPRLKIARTRAFGAEVVPYDRVKEDRDAIARELCSSRHAAYVHPFDDPDVIAGQGTAAKELIEDAGPLDMLLVCLGGGGLLAGCALAAKALNPTCRVFGVEPEAGNDGQQSLRSGKIVKIPVPKTIADGAQTPFLGDYTFPIIQALVEDIVTVSDEALVAAMRFFAERMKLVVEPTGCLAAAAAFTGAVPVEGRRVGVIISGGNVDLGSYARFLAPAG
jgi:threonine dehydratase